MLNSEHLIQKLIEHFWTVFEAKDISRPTQKGRYHKFHWYFTTIKSCTTRLYFSQQLRHSIRRWKNYFVNSVYSHDVKAAMLGEWRYSWDVFGEEKSLFTDFLCANNAISHHLEPWQRTIIVCPKVTICTLEEFAVQSDFERN